MVLHLTRPREVLHTQFDCPMVGLTRGGRQAVWDLHAAAAKQSRTYRQTNQRLGKSVTTNHIVPEFLDCLAATARQSGIAWRPPPELLEAVKMREFIRGRKLFGLLGYYKFNTKSKLNSF